MKKPEICRAYRRGSCRYGDDCWFIHTRKSRSRSRSRSHSRSRSRSRTRTGGPLGSRISNSWRPEYSSDEQTEVDTHRNRDRDRHWSPERQTEEGTSSRPLASRIQSSVTPHSITPIHASLPRRPPYPVPSVPSEHLSGASTSVNAAQDQSLAEPPLFTRTQTPYSAPTPDPIPSTPTAAPSETAPVVIKAEPEPEAEAEAEAKPDRSMLDRWALYKRLGHELETMDTLQRENDELRAQNEGWAQEKAELVRRAERAETSARLAREEERITAERAQKLREQESHRLDEEVKRRVLEVQREVHELRQKLEDAEHDKTLVSEALEKERIRRREAEQRAREGDEELEEIGGVLDRLKRRRTQ
ncbi:hypothetical protein CYLTODRAFT_425341 [Cylindrobasidium torrendii FP15055 ss-10]|uniref:C3H1-type domain-containing protein n=1 Tax=Cylindrobasidium torrendii FP15055 ss-10 TaxID=1314674 RepID=A0A0D7B2B7_9AGAR|nr:hypothetical protein CYLTODRAFT_425341 [Cylindrobasidium torrendii FP15055 ss-10]